MPRRLGQHFLQSQPILRKIALAVCGGDSPQVVEIGPGRGALTEHLLACAGRVTAIEVDPAMVGHLRNRFAGEDRLDVIQADILEFNLGARLPAVIAGNLPYYITSPILERVVSLAGSFPRAVFLVQKEVADRLTAEPGTRDYGFLTIQTLLMTEVRTLFPVPPGAFAPPPKVDSAVVELVPRPTPLTADPAAFLKFASACFRSKRKTLRNNLRYVYPAIEGLPEAGLRAEQLSLDQLIALQQTVA